MTLLEDSPSSTSVPFPGCFSTHGFLLLQRAPLITSLCRRWSTSIPMRWSWQLATRAPLRPSWRKLPASGNSKLSWRSVRHSARWGPSCLSAPGAMLSCAFLLNSCLWRQAEHYRSSSAVERLKTARSPTQCPSVGGLYLCSITWYFCGSDKNWVLISLQLHCRTYVAGDQLDSPSF